jgi:hypothetical protein
MGRQPLSVAGRRRKVGTATGTDDGRLKLDGIESGWFMSMLHYEKIQVAFGCEFTPCGRPGRVYTGVLTDKPLDVSCQRFSKSFAETTQPTIAFSPTFLNRGDQFGI